MKNRLLNLTKIVRSAVIRAHVHQNKRKSFDQRSSSNDFRLGQKGFPLRYGASVEIVKKTMKNQLLKTTEIKMFKTHTYKEVFNIKFARIMTKVL